MKLSEYQAQLRHDDETAEANHQRRCVALLERVTAADHPVYVPPATPRDSTDYTQVRVTTRARLAVGGLTLKGIECDHCETELVTDGNLLMSNPPSYRLLCAGCGWIGSVCE